MPKLAKATDLTLEIRNVSTSKDKLPYRLV
jgi:hypothetical protein